MSACTRSASNAMLRFRAGILSRIRAFFDARGALEVETPALSAAAVTDLHLDSIAAEVRSLGRRYLHTSPEYPMKRLLADGVGDIYQICRVFRDGEIGRWHQPEFTLLEWYRVGWDEHRLMDEVEALLGPVLSGSDTAAPARRLRYRDAFAAALGVDPFDPHCPLAAALSGHGTDVPEDLERHELLDLAFSTVIAPRFETGRLTFVHDFPPEQAALARIRDGTPPVAARFEAFAGGIELANGFAELIDAEEQRQRFERELAARRVRGRAEPPVDETFLAALAQGLPECAGVAVGVDRLVAVAAGAPGVAAALSFVHDEPFGPAEPRFRC